MLHLQSAAQHGVYLHEKSICKKRKGKKEKVIRLWYTKKRLDVEEHILSVEMVNEVQQPLLLLETPAEKCASYENIIVVTPSFCKHSHNNWAKGKSGFYYLSTK